MKPSDALEAQVEIRDICRANAARAVGDERSLWRSVAEMLDEADTYFWARPMCALLEHAAQSLPQSWAFSWTRVPSRVGFALFDRPLGWGVGGQEAAWVGAISWFGGTLSTDTSKRVVNFCIFEEVEQGMAPKLTGQFVDGETLLDCVRKAPYDDPHELLLVCLGATLFATSLTILEQRVAVGREQTAERHARKRVARRGWTHEPVVRVVELRRKQARSERHGESEPVAWSHQWIVGGHWRQQWYPSLNDHQPRWIMPYVKGPEDAPLKPPRAKVFAVVR